MDFAPMAESLAPIVPAEVVAASQPDPVKLPSVNPTPIEAPTIESKESVKPIEDSAAQKAISVEDVDYTKIPREIEDKLTEFDEDNSVRPTIINVGTTWEKTSQASLLSEPSEAILFQEEQDEAKKKAFDLLDALTRSGNLTVDHASLHIVIAATHCFDRSLVDTVVKDNVNPIEKVERTALILASTVHRTEPASLLQRDQVVRIKEFSAPKLLTQ